MKGTSERTRRGRLRVLALEVLLELVLDLVLEVADGLLELVDDLLLDVVGPLRPLVDDVLLDLLVDLLDLLGDLLGVLSVASVLVVVVVLGPRSGEGELAEEGHVPGALLLGAVAVQAPLGLLDPALLGCLLETLKPQVGHLVIALVVELLIVAVVVGLLLGLRAIGSSHVDQEDLLLVIAELLDDLLELVVHLVDAVVDIPVAVVDQGRSDDHRVLGLVEQVLDEAFVALTSLVDVLVLDSILGTSIDQEDVGEETRNRLVAHGLVADLVDEQVRPALVVLVGKVTVLAATDHVDRVALLDDLFTELPAEAVALGRALAPDGSATDGHDTEHGAIGLFHSLALVAAGLEPIIGKGARSRQKAEESELDLHCE